MTPKKSGDEGRRKYRWERVAALSAAVVAVCTVVGLILANSSGGPPAPVARVRLIRPANDAFVPQPVGLLPRPPGFPPAAKNDHCPQWRGWLDRIGAAVTAPPMVEISAPSSAPVTVTRARFGVYRSFRPTHLSFIMCVLGAGPYPGTILLRGLDNPSAPSTLIPDGSDRQFKLPPATFRVAPGATEVLVLEPDGHTPRFYDWGAHLELVVDQRHQQVDLGSPAHPLRSYLGSAAGVPSYDYDPLHHKWVHSS
jgi:hypothetical protein